MSDKFAVLRKSVDSDWTVVAVWDTWQEADRDCEQRRKNEADEAMYTWERVFEPISPCRDCGNGWASVSSNGTSDSCHKKCKLLAEYNRDRLKWARVTADQKQCCCDTRRKEDVSE